MKHVNSLRWLLAAVLSSCFAISAHAQGFEFDSSSQPVDSGTVQADSGDIATISERMSGVSETVISETVFGSWIWTDDYEDDLDGAVVVLPDEKDPKTLYAGGYGFLRVSRDGGVSWKTAFNFDSGGDKQESAELLSKLSDEEIVNTKRAFIRNELTTTYDSEFADTIDDEISDEELLAASTTDDLNIFSEYELDIERDLMRAFDELSVDEGNESNEVSSDGRDFVSRYLYFLDLGANEEEALVKATEENAVWKLISYQGKVWAVTRDALYVSSDNGATWTTISAPNDVQFISLDVSLSGQRITLGTNQGLWVSKDGGTTWGQSRGVFDGVPYMLTHTSDDLLVIGTPEVVYVSSDAGESVIPLSHFVANRGDHITDIKGGMNSLLMIATESGVYSSKDLVNFNRLDTASIEGSAIRQVETLDGTDSNILVRTEECVYINQGDQWIREIEGLFGEQTRNVVLTPKDKANAAIMVTDSNVLVASRDRKKLNDEGRLDLLKRQWATEPTPERILHEALVAHALEENAHDRFKARLWSSMILPNFRFSYSRLETATDKSQIISDNKNGGAISKTTWQQTRDTQTTWEVSALWNFELGKDESNEMALDRYMYSQNRQRLTIVSQVMKVLRKRYSKQMAGVKSKQKNAKNEVKRFLLIEEIDAQLYYLTGGFFTPKYNYK